MKRLLSLLLVCALLSGCTGAQAQELSAPPQSVAPAASEQADRALSQLGISILQESDGGRESVLLSPLSIALALCMDANGAAGDTLAEFETLMGGISLEELNAACAYWTERYTTLGGSTRCSIANSLWADPQGEIAPDFIGKCIGIYDAQLFQEELSDRGIVSKVNRWVEDHTEGMIPSILSQPFPDATALLLVNALYLENRWESPFDPNSTHDRDFTHADGQVEQLSYLGRGTASLPYFWSDNCQGVLLPYDDGELAFFALLPDDTLEEFCAQLSGERLTELLSSCQETRFLSLQLPKFEAEWRGDLTALLPTLGLELASTPGEADFSNLGSSEGGYYISQVIHAARIEVNEEGTKAAAATLVANAGAGAPPEDGIQLVFDRPFLYGIVDMESWAPLFLGTFT